MTRKYAVGVLFGVLFAFCGGTAGQYDVPYEPSEYKIVDEMLKLAKVGKSDIVYDLGCGDGRIVITAAKKFGAKGVGIDIDPVRIKESKKNAAKAKVTGRVRFIEQNLFDADIREATVMMLFLWPEVNLRLRPKLFRELNPGTRIVSHEHDMGAWESEQSIKMEVDGWNHTIYLWELPANVSGTWEWPAADSGEKRHTLTLTQKFQKVSGALTIGDSSLTIKDMVINGDRLRFTVEEQSGNRTGTRHFEGRARGDVIEGAIVSNNGKGKDKTLWTAKRDPSTAAPVDE